MGGERTMKRGLLGLLIIVAGVGGFLMIFCGVLFATGMPAQPASRAWWRVASVGMIMMGLSMVPSLNRLPDYVPRWVQRRFVPGFVLLWLLIGAALFIVSWL